MNFDADSQNYGSLTGVRVEHSALQSVNVLDDSNNPQDQFNGMAPLDFDPNAKENVVHGDNASSAAHQSANPLGDNLIIEQDDGEKADGEDDDNFDYEDAKVDNNRQNFELDDDEEDGDFF